MYINNTRKLVENGELTHYNELYEKLSKELGEEKFVEKYASTPYEEEFSLFLEE